MATGIGDARQIQYLTEGCMDPDLTVVPCNAACLCRRVRPRLQACRDHSFFSSPIAAADPLFFSSIAASLQSARFVCQLLKTEAFNSIPFLLAGSSLGYAHRSFASPTIVLISIPLFRLGI